MDNLKLLLNKPIAHRGLHDNLIPENSLSAISKAFANNYNVEIDVRLTKDHQVIVFHDESLLRMTGINKLVSETPYEELKHLSLSNSNEKIPLLEDAIELCKDDSLLLVELKSDIYNNKLESAIINLLRHTDKNIAFQSFNPLTVIRLKRSFKNIPIGYITSDFKDEEINFFLKCVLTNFVTYKLISPNFLAFDINIDNPKKLEYFKSLGMPLLAWTIRDSNNLTKANIFADNIIFERIIP